MAKLLLNLCLDSQMQDVQVVPGGQGGAPTPPPYWFAVYWNREEIPVPTKDEKFSLDRVGPCRVLVWDSEPDSLPTPFGPGSQDPSIRVNLDGTASLISCGPDDPWPQT